MVGVEVFYLSFHQSKMHLNYVYILIISHGVVLTSTYESRGNNETRFNNCLTWRDDQTTLILTCRVNDFFLPITFIHRKSNTRVKCYIDRKHKHCLKEEKKISINKYKHTVTIELSVHKLGRNIEGNWRCRQGNRTQATIVSLSTGIKIDSWVQIVGKHIFKNETKYLILECSSCRKPQGLYAEFLINDLTEASIWLDDHGNCVYKNENCSENICACSSTENMFLFRLKVKDLQTAANLSCDMQFIDELRQGRFSTTAKTTYTGKDFTKTEYRTAVITPNIISKDPEKERTTKQINGSDHNLTSKNSSTDVEGQNSLEVIIPLVISVTGISIGSGFAVYKWRKETKKDKGIGYQDESETLLNKAPKCKNCADRLHNRRADFICFECRQFFCHTCLERVHCTSELRQHTHVKTSKVPASFPLSLFSCSEEGHNNSILDLICTNHNTVICIICRTTIHKECHIDIVSQVSVKEVNEKTENYLLEMHDLNGKLTAFQDLINKSMTVTKLHRRQVNKDIDDSSEKLFSLIEEGKTIEKDLKRDDVKQKIDSIEKDFNREKRKLIPNIETIRDKIEKQEKIVTFISKYGKTYQQKILLSSLKMKLDEIRSMIRDNEESFNPIRIEFDGGASIVRITKVNTTKDTQSDHCLGTVDKVSTISSRTQALEDLGTESLEMKNACVEKPISIEVHSPKTADYAKKTTFTDETSLISPQLID